mgnify:CR=1 FL=1
MSQTIVEKGADRRAERADGRALRCSIASTCANTVRDRRGWVILLQVVHVADATEADLPDGHTEQVALPVVLFA